MLHELADRLGPTSSFVQRYERYEKTAVGIIGGTANPAHLEAGLALAFLDRVAGRRLTAQLPFLPLPANSWAPVAGTAGTAGFVAEGRPIPVTRFDVGVQYIGGSKISIIGVFPDSLLMATSYRAVSLLERHLGRVVVEGEDAELLSTDAAVAGERPAGLLYGKSAVAAGSPGSLAEDIELLFAETRGGAPDRPWFIVSPRGAVYLSLLRGADGPMFPDIGVTGGTLAGVPVAISKAAGNKLILVDAEGIGVWDGGMVTDMSDQALLQMNDAPSAGPQNATSLFQTNATAVRLIRLVDWVAGYPDAVNFITLPFAGSPS
jgi:hypothetical protein